MDNFWIYTLLGFLYTAVTAHWAISEKDKCKNEDGTSSPMTVRALISGTLFLGPYGIGAFLGCFGPVGPIALFPPFAFVALMDALEHLAN